MNSMVSLMEMEGTPFLKEKPLERNYCKAYLCNTVLPPIYNA
jgi:hypothetical protein